MTITFQVERSVLQLPSPSECLISLYIHIDKELSTFLGFPILGDSGRREAGRDIKQAEGLCEQLGDRTTPCHRLTLASSSRIHADLRFHDHTHTGSPVTHTGSKSSTILGPVSLWSGRAKVYVTSAPE